MMNEPNEDLFSQLADGELDSDHANAVLLEVLDDPAERERLKGMLRLRRATAAWRTRGPTRPLMIVAEPARPVRRGLRIWRAGSLAVAACVGGLLVLAGVWAAGGLGRPARPTDQWRVAPASDGPPAVARVTPERMQQVAKVFALHESVAGPLAWYAADDQNVRVSSAQGPASGQAPIAVLLTLGAESPGAAPRTLVIVCRDQEPAVIELPPESAGRAGLRVYLSPRKVNGKVDVQYAIAVASSARQPAAGLSGERRVGLSQTPLGQLAVGDRLLNVEATAWPLRAEKN